MIKTIVIGGAAGEGINTAEQFIEKIVKGNGLNFLSYKNYMSRVRGGYNFTTITLGDETIDSIEHRADLFLALNAEATEHAELQVKTNGVIVTTERVHHEPALRSKQISLYSEDLKAIRNSNAGTMAGVGAILAYLGFKANIIDDLVMAKWSEQVNAQNLEAALLGFNILADWNKKSFEPQVRSKAQLMVNGNQAVALGALAAGLGFYCAYPMAPSTGIMSYLAKNQKKMNIVVEQAEDEISAIMAAIGSASNGVRSMTGTSGGGFSLMVEALGFAAVAEVPLVICNVQRPGPATGLPTRTEQADLLFTVFASQGEFSRIVLAPTSIEDAFYTTFRAFNYAEAFQVPVIILTDQYLADSTTVVPSFDLEGLIIERSLSYDVEEDYKRYDFQRLSGGRKYPGIDRETLIMTDSHVHDEYGHVTEDSLATIQLKDKFLKRHKAIEKALKAPTFVGVDTYEYLMIAWGSTGSVLRSAVQKLNAKGIQVGGLIFSDVYPISEKCFEPYLRKGVKIINVEGNATNQFGKLIRMETGINFDEAINKYDGRPFSDEEIVSAVEVIVNGNR